LTKPAISNPNPRMGLFGIFQSCLSPQMRAPEAGCLGWLNICSRLAEAAMERVNKKSIETAIQRFNVRDGEVFVELGAGHGFALEELFCNLEVRPARVVAVEISSVFRDRLAKRRGEMALSLAEKEKNCAKGEDSKSSLSKTTSSSKTTTLSTLPNPLYEIRGDDAIDMSRFLEDNSVDKLFAMNVVYFLDPLELYLKEIHRVLKAGTGKVLLGCKFHMVKENPPPFVNKELQPLTELMESVGFDVATEEVDVGTGDVKHNFTAVVGTKRYS